MTIQETRHKYYLKNKEYLTVKRQLYYYYNQEIIKNKSKQYYYDNRIKNKIYLTEHPIIEIINKPITLYFS